MAVASQGLPPMVPMAPVPPLLQPPVNMNLLLLAMFYNNFNWPLFSDTGAKNFSVEAINEQK